MKCLAVVLIILGIVGWRIGADVETARRFVDLGPVRSHARDHESFAIPPIAAPARSASWGGWDCCSCLRRRQGPRSIRESRWLDSVFREGGDGARHASCHELCVAWSLASSRLKPGDLGASVGWVLDVPLETLSVSFVPIVLVPGGGLYCCACPPPVSPRPSIITSSIDFRPRRHLRCPFGGHFRWRTSKASHHDSAL